MSELKKFRYDISLLRTIAVFAVVFFHFQLPYFSGGFAGVDIFFVISGFLMTRIILMGYDTESFSFLAFYAKRLQRIFPALMAMILFFFVIVYFITPLQLLSYSSTVVQSLLFVSNMYFYKNTGYFQESAHNNFLLHTWSLSIEWQFYLLFPLILFMVRYSSKAKKVIFLVLMSLFSFLVMIYIGKYDKSPAFFLLPPRAWEMIVGGIAFLLSNKVKNMKAFMLYPLYFLSFIIIFYSVLRANAISWPDYHTLLPTLSTAFILSADVDFTIFRNKIVKYLGDVSYSLYLYHWPLYVISLFTGHNFLLSEKLLFILLGFGLAALSYQYIEKRNYRNRSIAIIVVNAIIVAFAWTLIPLTKDVLKENYSLAATEANYPKSNAAKQQYLMETKHFMSTQNFSSFDVKNFDQVVGNKKNIILLGDSHAGMFSETIRTISSENNWNLIQFTADATYPQPNSPGVFKGPIDYFNYFYNQYLPKNESQIDLVIINANYAGYSIEDILKRTGSTKNYFNQKGIPLVFIGLTPQYAISFPSYYYATVFQNRNFKKQSLIEQSNNKVNEALDKQLGNFYINIYKIPVQTISKDNFPYIYDSNHLTFYGTELYKEVLRKKLQTLLN